MKQNQKVTFVVKKLYRKLWQTFLYAIWKIFSAPPTRKRLPDRVENILFMPVGGIGNVVLFTPLVLELRERYPQAVFTFVMRSRGGAEVVRGYPRSQVFEFDFKNMGNVRRFVRRHRLPRFDLALNCETFYGAYLAFKYRTRFLVSFTYSFGITAQSNFLCARSCNVDHSKHEVLQNLDLLRLIFPEPDRAEIRSFFMYSGEEIAFASNRLEEFDGDELLIGMHIGSLPQVPEKRWPVERFAELAIKLSHTVHARIVVMGGASERKIVNRFLQIVDSKVKVLDLVGKTGLKKDAALIQRCDLFISNDSGPMHIAAAVGTPVIGIFGPTNPVKNRPWGSETEAIVVRKTLPCSPCYVAFSAHIECTNPNRLECMDLISVDEVFEQVETILEDLRDDEEDTRR